MTPQETLERLRAMGDPRNVEGMARFGIVSAKAFGIGVVPLRKLAKEIGRDQKLAEGLWETGVHEARVLACFIADPGTITQETAEAWAGDFDNWAVCDACCWHLLDKTPLAWKLAKSWSRRKEEFVKRGGFAIMASLAMHDKAAPDAKFVALLPLIERESVDERNFVRKAVNWALRQIGKRNESLRPLAIASAERILAKDTKASRWVARDALRELRRTTTRARKST